MTTEPGAPTARDYRAAADELAGWRHPLLLTHERPDGDALGCLLAVYDVLRSRGVDACAMLFEPLPARYAFMSGVEALHVLTGADDPVLARADGVLVMDTCALGQLTPVADFLRQTAAPIIALDHHRTRDLSAGRYLVDADAAAASLLVYDWAAAAGWELSNGAREALFVGIATDTGWFRFSNTSAACLRAAADLVERGVNVDRLHQALYLSDSTQVLRARALAQASLELHRDGRVAVMMVSEEALVRVGANAGDLEDSVNSPMSAAAVEVSMLLVERKDGVTKCSLRSKGAVDVARVAARFGGGGHVRAAGVRIEKSMSAARDALLAAILL